MFMVEKDGELSILRHSLLLFSYYTAITIYLFTFCLTHVPYSCNSISRYTRYWDTHTSTTRYHLPLWRERSMESLFSGNLLYRYVCLRSRIRATLRQVREEESALRDNQFQLARIYHPLFLIIEWDHISRYGHIIYHIPGS